MNEAEIKQRILAGRNFITGFGDDMDTEDYHTDQELKKPQPPLAKAPMGGERIDLPVDFDSINIESDFLKIINSRKSSRVYTGAPVSLTELSYLLWCSQGVKAIRGKAYATLRTVPSGGARHPFESYLTVRHVTGLLDGLYHYLPLTHQLERLENAHIRDEAISEAVCGQTWAAKANLVFFYSCVFYRAEWRYGIWAHGPVLMDSGHVTENLYLAATSIGLGGCAIAAVDPGAANSLFGLDGEEESIFYAMPVGRVRSEDQAEEDAFYAFVREQNL